MASVLPEMECDPIGSPEFGEGRRPHGIGFNGPTGLPNGGDVVNVDAEKCHTEVSFPL